MNADSSPDGAPFEMDYGRVENLAQGHDRSAEALREWADADAHFAERFLITHGRVAYDTYLKVRDYTATRCSRASDYADRNATTARSLRDFSALIGATDDNTAAALRAPGTTA